MYYICTVVILTQKVMDEKYLKLLEQFKKENFKKKIRHKNETEKLYHVDVYMPQQLIESSRSLLMEI